ncbi:sugar phosphate isomerase/epimerase family protein [Georgenia sp. MJ170]|uniref:sugar phosphate isomerase/epimerase family protein n=1 Tax=Georgenia sunbinii TaxID=3117728 RepID=UPI002F26147F
MTTPATSVQLYTLRELIAADLPGTLRELAAIGLTAVEPHRFHFDVAGMRRALAGAGLTAPSAHARLLQPADDDAPGRLTIGPDAGAILDAAAELGIATVVQPTVPRETWQSAGAVAALAERLNEVAAIAAGRGVQVGYHNHAFELEQSRWHTDPGHSAIEVLAAALDPAVVLEIDTYWAAVGGLEPVALLQRLGRRVALLHVKDGPVTAAAGDQLPLGEGRMPIPEILRTAAHARPVIELDDYRGDVLDAVRRSYRYLSGVRP